MRKFPVPFFFVVLLLGGCASVSVDRVETVSSAVRPDCIYVQEFVAPRGVFRVDRKGVSLEEFRTTMSRQLAKETALRVGKRLVPSQAIPRSAALPVARAWLVTGRFVRVNQGSRALRTAIGLGLGGTKIETEVSVYDLSTSPPREILRFVTTGGSNAMPGVAPGAVLPNVWLLSLDTLVKMGPGLSVDMIRTSREIVAVLSEEMARDGFLPPKKIYRAKKLGKWP
jgi:hypothetical protein